MKDIHIFFNVFRKMNIDELSDYLRSLLNLLDEYKWSYDFQVIEIFDNEILENKFPNEV